MNEKLFCIICSKELEGNQKKYCCNNCKQRAHYQEKRSNPNSCYSQTKRAVRRKLELIKLAGGSCSRCGYNKNISALEFHHVNAKTKKFSLDSRSLSNSSIERVIEEYAKCILLCSNCHAEIHYPDNEYKILLDNIEKYK